MNHQPWMWMSCGIATAAGVIISKQPLVMFVMAIPGFITILELLLRG